MKNFFIVWGFVSILVFFFTIQGIEAQTDSTLLSYQAYIEHILVNHPVAKQAALKEQLASAEWLGAKGGFDPKLSSGWNQKNFDEKFYYQQYQGKISIPTRLGIDLIGGYENTDGVFLNPENKTDKNGLWHVGIEVNVLQGLLVNERQNALQQAKLFQEIALNEQRLILNDLLFSASIAYLEWQRSHYQREIIQESIVLSRNYLEATRLAFINGEKTGMDTLEAFIALQDRLVLLQNNQAVLIKAQQQLENYLWFKDLPVTLEITAYPEPTSTILFQSANEEMLNELVAKHPQVLEKLLKKSSLEIDQRWKREKLKPKLKVKYNPLLATQENSIIPAYTTSDYKWGFDFSMPLFMRRERADIQRGLIKLKEVDLELEDKRNMLQNKMEAALLQQVIYEEQIAFVRQNIAGYRLLLEGENDKFLYGESSVFLLNKRQEKYIDSQLKLIDLINKYQLSLLEYLYFTNQLVND